MYEFLSKKGQLIAFGLGLLIIVIFLLMVNGGVSEFNSMSSDMQKQTTLFNFGLRAAQIMIYLCAIIAVLFGVWFVVTHFKSSIKSLIGLAVLLILFFILYSSADPEGTGSLAKTIEKFAISPGESKFIGGAVSTAMALAGIAVLAFVVSEVRNLFK